LSIKANGLSTVNGLTFHVLAAPGDSSYLHKSDVYEVTPAIPTDDEANRLYTPLHDAWDAATNTPVGFFGVDVAGVTVGDASDTGPSSPNGRAIQRAVQAAYRDGNEGADPKLVVIYPNTADNYAAHNPNAAYFENVVLHGNVKLQGVGPGGATSSTNFVYGTNIDASQFWSATQVVPDGGNQQTADGSYSDDWRTFGYGLTVAGNGPADLPEGEGVLAIAESDGQYGSASAANSATFRAGVDGMLLSGANQNGNPGNVNTTPNAIGDVPAPTNPGPAQGGAIMIDQYVRDFNITNNQIQSNGGTYGTIRVGTPDLPGANSSNHNDRLNVANNRLVANGGTNLAGALGIFAGADNYTVTGNDFCGNFSAEYGGAISHYGLSAGGKITKNRIYYNQSYDEGGGIMIAGALPAANNTLSPGAGTVTIDSNTLISNQSNDDGGGIRFLMAGAAPFLVQNNIIANNLSTHEGGGVALDDAPNVTLVNNTIVKNITTATSATNGAIGTAPTSYKPANPAGLSTGGNSTLLQATLPAGSPNWSKPTLLNNIFADNRAGWADGVPSADQTKPAVHGIGAPNDTVAIQRWDIGVSSATGLNNGSAGAFAFTGVSNTTNTRTSSGPIAAQLVNALAGRVSFVGTQNVNRNLDGTVPRTSGGVGFVKPQDFSVDTLNWRTNVNASFPIIVAQMVPINLLADYHLMSPSATFALNRGSANNAAGTSAPAVDIDGDARPAPAGGAFDRGADELGTTVDFGVTKTVSPTTVDRGGKLTYTITATNFGSNAGTVRVSDNIPSGITGTWSCVTNNGGPPCPTTPLGTGNLAVNVTLSAGGQVTFVYNGTVSLTSPVGARTNTATVSPAPGSGVTDTNAANNSAQATVTVQARGNLKVVVTATVPATINNVPSTVRRGDILGYVITITNTGPVAMQERFGTSHTGTFTGQAVWSCTTTVTGSNCGGDTAGTNNVPTHIVTVAPGGTVTYTYSTSTTGPAQDRWTVANSNAINSQISETGTLTANVPNYIDTTSTDNVSTMTSTVTA
jgi:uncharacterized repeat protein (TIGR01451 family)